MFNSRLELCDGIVASFNEEKNVYICHVAWLGREIEIWLSSGDYSDVSEINSLKMTFEKFWNEKVDFLTISQSDIKERLIPYIAKKRASDKKSLYREVSEDDFDAEYWLTSVYIIGTIDEAYGEVQMNFYKNGDEDLFESFFVSRDIDSGYVTFYFDYDIIADEI